ncbi:sortase domain-containing protein [Lacticaseibacillus zhaodongensis]|uniref:sortase domain-containing protein n=1 Tax=Lacticaseibacillus zhaodongensis TaxID=2668065 RepID=UPI0012D37066|nr:sortase [Lacticaseibacillus zhaodongensis]
MKTKYFSIAAAVVLLTGGGILGGASAQKVGTRTALAEDVRISQRVSTQPSGGRRLRVAPGVVQSEAPSQSVSKPEVTIKSRQQLALRPTAVKIQARSTIAFLGTVTPIITGSRAVTTAPSGNRAQTWGGQTHLSVTDGQSTHMIGHNTTNFGLITKMKVGTPITVRDSAGHTRVYHVTWHKNVTDRGDIAGTKTSVYKDIVDARQGEQIVLQTCINDSINRVVWAR